MLLGLANEIKFFVFFYLKSSDKLFILIALVQAILFGRLKSHKIVINKTPKFGLYLSEVYTPSKFCYIIFESHFI